MEKVQRKRRIGKRHGMAEEAGVDSGGRAPYLGIMSDPVRKPDRRYTYKDYCGWPENERWELIDGTPYNMSPAPTPRHQAISLEISRQIANFLVDKSCRIFTAPFDVRLPSLPDENDEDVETVVQPDLAVVCNGAKIDEAGCRGAPDWIIEILSPSTASKDLKNKRALYERHGVRELWFVHPTDRTVMVLRIDGSGGYGRALFFDAEDTVGSTILPGLTVAMGLVFRKAEK